MKCGARVALGVAGGYFLGRTKKMKLVLMLGSVAAGRRAGGPGELLGQATKVLGASPELTRLSDEVKGRLLDAGKGAALAVAARQVEALTDRVGKRVESIGEVGRGAAKRDNARSREDDTGDDTSDDKTDAEHDEYESSDTGAEAVADVEGAPEPAQALADEDGDRPSSRGSTRRNRSSAGRADGARRTASRATAGAAKAARPTRAGRSNNG